MSLRYYEETFTSQFSNRVRTRRDQLAAHRFTPTNHNARLHAQPVGRDHRKAQLRSQSSGREEIDKAA